MNAIIHKWKNLKSRLRSQRFYENLEAVRLRLKKIGIYIQANHFYASSPKSPPRIPSVPEFMFRTITIDEVDILTSVDGKDGEIFRQRISEYEDECNGMYFKNQLVGYAWLARKRMRMPEIRFERSLRNNEIYAYDGVINPNLGRIGGFIRIYLLHLLKEAASSGGTLISTTSFTNRKVTRLLFRLGYSYIGTCIYINLWKLVKFRFNTLKKYQK